MSAVMTDDSACTRVRRARPSTTLETTVDTTSTTSVSSIAPTEKMLGSSSSSAAIPPSIAERVLGQDPELAERLSASLTEGELIELPAQPLDPSSIAAADDASDAVATGAAPRLAQQLESERQRGTNELAVRVVRGAATVSVDHPTLVPADPTDVGTADLARTNPDGVSPLAGGGAVDPSRISH